MDGFKSSPKMQCFKEGGAVKYKSRHSEKSEVSKDIAKDKKIVKKAFAMHDKQSHEGEKTDLKKLNKGGRMKKDSGCVGRYQAGGSIKMKKDAADIKDIQKIKLTKTKKAAAPSKAAIKPAMSNIAEPAPDMGTMSPMMMKKGKSVKKYNAGRLVSYDEAMKTSGGAKKLADAKLAGTLKATPISETELSSISDSGAAKGLRNYGRMYKQGLGMKPDTDYEYKKGGNVKKCSNGGSLKPVDAEKNPGLAELPTNVRNKMGYVKKGGKVKKYNAGKLVTDEESARMPAGKLPQQVVDEEAMASNTETREMVAGPLRKLKQGIMEKFKSKSKTPVAPMRNGGKAC